MFSVCQAATLQSLYFKREAKLSPNKQRPLLTLQVTWTLPRRSSVPSVYWMAACACLILWPESIPSPRRCGARRISPACLVSASSTRWTSWGPTSSSKSPTTWLFDLAGFLLVEFLARNGRCQSSIHQSINAVPARMSVLLMQRSVCCLFGSTAERGKGSSWQRNLF